MRLLSVIGTRPQFVKEAMLNQAVIAHNRNNRRHKITEILVHTGQHYDHRMSQVFFDQLTIPSPQHNLGVKEDTHGKMVGTMLCRIEKVMMDEKPDWVVVFGDSNSTLAGALAGVKLGLPVAHVEAGLRSRNRRMPEEINRILTDQISELLFCPTDTAMGNLEKEGLAARAVQTGDIMLDAFLAYKDIALEKSSSLQEIGILPGKYCFATVHREENTNTSDRLKNIFSAFSILATEECPFIVALHPRTKKALEQIDSFPELSTFVRVISPRNYLENLALICSARVILTDSGGMQKEAFFAHVPCITLRQETEWEETLTHGWNQIAGAESEVICQAYSRVKKSGSVPPLELFGGGDSRFKILENLIS